MKALQKRILVLTLTSTLALTPTFNLKADPTDLFDVKAVATSLILIGGFCYYFFQQKPVAKPTEQLPAAQPKKFVVKANQTGALHINVKQNEQFKLILEKTDTVTAHYLTSNFSYGLAKMEAVGQDHPDRTSYDFVATRPGTTTCCLEKQLHSERNPMQLCRVTGCDITLHIE